MEIPYFYSIYTEKNGHEAYLWNTHTNLAQNTNQESKYLSTNYVYECI